MTCLRLSLILVFSASLASAVPVIAQNAPPTPPAGAGAPSGAGGGGGRGGGRGGPRPAPTNLKVLPKTMTGDEVAALMRTFTGALGVECEFCHAQNPETKRNDPPSDANPMKDNARLMIKMTDTINASYVTQLANQKDPVVPVTCGTCHRGQAHPSVFVPPPQQRPGGGPGGPPAGPPPAK
jgi:hypothetical protein